MFTRFYKKRSPKFKGHNFIVDTRTMTVPDAVPTLKEIILSGSAQRVGTPEYDETFEEGAMRWKVQNAPLDVVLNGAEEGFNDVERSDQEDKSSEAKVKDNGPAADTQPEAE